jgi:hypothetical protein
MLCPDNANADFDDMLCRDCKHFQYCFERWQTMENYGNKEESSGDNYPQFDKEKQKEELNRLGQGLDKLGNINIQEQEIKHSIDTIGDFETWKMIEYIADPILRLRYRFIFIKLGGRIPEKEE